jgi:hypothetical protein
MKMTVHPAVKPKYSIMDRICIAVWGQDELWDLYKNSADGELGNKSVTEFVTCNFEALLDKLPGIKADHLRENAQPA